MNTPAKQGPALCEQLSTGRSNQTSVNIRVLRKLDGLTLHAQCTMVKWREDGETKRAGISAGPIGACGLYGGAA